MLWTPPPADEAPLPDPRWANFVGGTAADGAVRAMQRSDLVATAADWVVDDDVPHGVAELLRVARELFVNAWWAYEFLALAAVWSLFAVEASLRDCLAPENDREGMRGLVREAAKRGLLDAELCDQLDAGAQLRNQFAHADEQAVFSPGMAESILRVSHESVSTIFRTVDLGKSEVRPLWDAMDAQQRVPAATATRASFPDKPGVYAWYRDGAAIYVGKASTLRGRVGGAHLSSSEDLTNSALRRNVAEQLDIGSAADIKAKRFRPDADAVARVGTWLRECEVAWIECDSPAEAADLEDRMKREWRPMLTRR